eukprot:11192270-Heterocapsa_arctica.AAC.1
MCRRILSGLVQLNWLAAAAERTALFRMRQARRAHLLLRAATRAALLAASAEAGEAWHPKAAAGSLRRAGEHELFPSLSSRR